jgi:hypothetical protein
MSTSQQHGTLGNVTTPHVYDPAPFFQAHGIYTPDARATLSPDELIITVDGEPVKRIPADDLETGDLVRLGDVLNWQATQQ